jgi:diacylglycerol kinase (ATP)
MPDMRTAPRLHPPVPAVPHLLSGVGPEGTVTWGPESELVRPLGRRDLTKVFVVLNPVAGDSDASIVRRTLEENLGDVNWHHEIYETTGEERIAEVVRGVLGRNFDMFIAAGGDGTVSGVAGGLIHSEIPLGIIPVGTGNSLARELGISPDLEDAIDLLTGEHTIARIDAMRVGDQFFVLNVGVGISALMMRDTERDDKRRFGSIAYLWTGLEKLFGLQPHRFTIAVDDRVDSFWASEVTVANSGAIGDPAFRWGPQVRLDDGRLDVCVVRAWSVIDYPRLAWSVLLGRQKHDPNMRCLSADRTIVITASQPLPVQGDGEFIGHTPVQVDVVPGAVQVIVPPTLGGAGTPEIAHRSG